MYSANANVTCRKDKSIPYSKPHLKNQCFWAETYWLELKRIKPLIQKCQLHFHIIHTVITNKCIQVVDKILPPKF